MKAEEVRDNMDKWRLKEIFSWIKQAAADNQYKIICGGFTSTYIVERLKKRGYTLKKACKSEDTMVVSWDKK